MKRHPSIVVAGLLLGVFLILGIHEKYTYLGVGIIVWTSLLYLVFPSDNETN